MTLEHAGSQGTSATELWLLSVSGEILVGVLGDSALGWRKGQRPVPPLAGPAMVHLSARHGRELPV